jgi:hypothetical protein
MPTPDQTSAPDLEADGQMSTSKLLEEERRLEIARRIGMGKLVLEIEEKFIAAGSTMGDVMEVFSMLTERANRVMSNIPLDKIKNDFNNIV